MLWLFFLKAGDSMEKCGLQMGGSTALLTVPKGLSLPLSHALESADSVAPCRDVGRCNEKDKWEAL